MATAKELKDALWTVHWYLKNQPDQTEKIRATVEEALGIDNTVEDRVGPTDKGAGLLWYPDAETDFPRGRIRGRYPKGYPIGAIVHHTAGRQNGLKNGMAFQTNQDKYLYFVIDENGRVGQNFPLDSWGYHCDPATWDGIESPLSKHLVGIEVMGAGLLNSSRQSWFNETYPAEDCRTVTTKEGYVHGGTYLKFTEDQERALETLLVWLYRNNPRVFSLDRVLGHDEVAPSRKNDPGGSLSLPMPGFRKRLIGLASK